MISPEVPPVAAESPGPEVMSFGPATPSRVRRRQWRLAIIAVCALLAGWGAWRLVPRPPPDFTLADLQGIYTGMVRSDGLNDVSTLSRDKLTEPPIEVTPAACVPLFDTTLSNQFPATAVDGVSTYWLNEASASISLVTYRYPDPAAARAQFDQVKTSLTGCPADSLTVDHNSAVSVAQQTVPAPPKVKNYLSYQVSFPPATTRFTIDVLQLNNTVTWQYRYDYRSRSNYSPEAAQQLMASMVTQMRSVQDAHS